MGFTFDLVINALIAGILLGGFYAAVTVGISISFGILDIVNIAHPAFIILGSYIAYIVNTRLGLDPILVSVLMLPVFYVLGTAVYQVYYASFERRGREALAGLAFFFGLLFITEVVLILVFGVDYRYVEAAYIGPSWHIGVVDLPLRMLVPCVVSLLMFARAADLPRRAPSSGAPSWRWRRIRSRSSSWRPRRPASSASPSAFRLRPRRSRARC